MLLRAENAMCKIWCGRPNVKSNAIMIIPSLTIAIPTFNRAIWLEQSLDIIENELKFLNHHVEVIISNNASTDDTNIVIEKHIRNNAFVFFEQSENIGAVRNIMFLTERAKGEYLWVLGDDDFIYKGFLNNLLNVIKNSENVSLFFIEMDVWHPSKNILRKSDLILDNYYKINYDSTGIEYRYYEKAANIADPLRGYFNALGNIILPKNDYLNAFNNSLLAGPEFTSVETTFPHAYYIAHHLLNKPCVHITSPGTYCSHAVSWKKYYDITYVKWYPELIMLMVKFGADKFKANSARNIIFIMYPDMIINILMHKAGNSKYFSLLTFVKNNYYFSNFWLLPLRIIKKLFKYIILFISNKYRF